MKKLVVDVTDVRESNYASTRHAAAMTTNENDHGSSMVIGDT